MDPIERVLAALEQQGLTTRPAGDGFVAQCPAHEDEEASLSVGEKPDGKVLLNCHAGCDSKDVVKKLGLEWPDLFPGERRSADVGRRRESDAPRPRGKIVATYPYKDEESELLFQALRLRPKSFRQRQHLPGHPDADRDGWVWSLGREGTEEKAEIPRVRLVPYHLPELLAGREDAAVWIPEGEKDVEGLEDLGLVATCNPMGAGKWQPEFSEYLKGCKVSVVVADCDDAGRKHAADVAECNYALGIPTKVLRLAERNDGFDVSDFKALHGDRTLDVLRDLYRKTPLWTPELANEGVVSISFADVEREPQEFLIEGRVPLGKLTMIVGDPGTGKSLLTCGWASLGSLGKLKGDLYGEAFDVVLVNAEDALGSTIKPRLEAAGADLPRVHALKKTQDGIEESLVIPDDIPQIEEAIVRHDAKLVIIDPLAAALPPTLNSNNDQHVRRALAPLYRLADRTGCTVVVVAHLNKSRTRALYRVGGSIGFTGAVRSLLAFAPWPKGSDKRALLHVKSNVGPLQQALIYEVESIDLPPKDGEPAVETARLNFLRTSKLDPDVVMAEEEEKR